MITDPIKILLTGDFCPINRIEKLALKKDYESIFNDYIDVFRGNDLNIVDLECPLTLSSKTRPKTGPHQKAHPDCINVLKYAGINVAAMANNHIMDYDNRGAEDTIALCKEKGICTVGIGKSKDEASKPSSLNIKGIRIAILNYADNEFLNSPDRSWLCNPIDPVKCFYEIKTARQENDSVILIVHAGNEFYELPSPRTKRLYRYLIDAGADAVISHHTHAWSGFEIYNSKPIFYGLGNFIYDWPGKINTRWNEGYAVRLVITDKIKFEIIPLAQCNDKPGIFKLNPEETETFNIELNRLNHIISDDLLLEAEFLRYCDSVFPMYEAFIEPNLGKFIAALRKRGLFPKLLPRHKRLLLLNLSRCESHREVLLKLLSKNE